MTDKELVKMLEYTLVYMALQETKRGIVEAQKIVDIFTLYDGNINDFPQAFKDYMKAKEAIK